MEVYANLQKRGKCVLLAACDAELLGKTLKEGKIVFHINEKFYKGVKTTVEEAVELMKQCTIVNLVGKNIVRKAIEAGLVHPEAVLLIEGIPHAQIIRL